MARLYFTSDSAGYVTIAVDADTNRACYLRENGTEGDMYPSRHCIEDKADAEREQIAEKWLRSIADYNNFDSLYADCDVDDGFVGVIPADGALDGIDVIATIVF